jgi:hypothetical protein
MIKPGEARKMIKPGEARKMIKPGEARKMIKDGSKRPTSSRAPRLENGQNFDQKSKKAGRGSSKGKNGGKVLEGSGDGGSFRIEYD